MADQQGGRPIPKIVGRGKNKLKRPYSAHSYELRSTANITRCQSSHGTPCSFCSFFRTSKEEIDEYNGVLRRQLLKTTTRALVIDRLRREKTEKVKKLRGLLQERSDELRDKNLQALAYMREVKVRQQELQHTVSQLQQSRFEITDLHSQLEHERKKVKILEEINSAEQADNGKLRENLIKIKDQLTPLIDELKQFIGSSGDSTSIVSRMENIKQSIEQHKNEVTPHTVEREAIKSSQSLINQIITEVMCGVCHEMFIDPVALPCGHTFCEFCIRMWFKRCCCCPVCRHRVMSCSQLHAIYQFREIVVLLNSIRSPEDQALRSGEITKRGDLSDELYHDPPPRRIRDRPSSTGDRSDRFIHRRRRLDQGGPNVPYPMPITQNSRSPIAIFDAMPLPQQQPQTNQPLLPPQNAFPVSNPFIEDVATNQSQEGTGNIMSLLLNETFSSIDRFIRNGPISIFPRTPLNMIEFTPADSSNSSDTTTQRPGIEVSGNGINQPITENSDEGSLHNPIVIADQEVSTSTTPPGTPPDHSYQSVLSGSSDEIWPDSPTVTDLRNYAVISSSEQSTQITTQQPHQEFAYQPPSIVELRGLIVDNSNDATHVIEIQESSEGISALLDGEFLSSISSYDDEEPESESESESSEEEEIPDVANSLEMVD